MEKTIKNIGLDVHKNSISIGIADDGQKWSNFFLVNLGNPCLILERSDIVFWRKVQH